MLLAVTLTVMQLVNINSNNGPNKVGQPEIQMVKSSWYGKWFNGKPMANGKPFNAEAMTVAHPDLPFGTKLLLFNLDNGRQVVVTVTDRGPYIRGRGLDCSEGVAKKLGFWRKGVQQLLTIRLNHIVRHPTLHPRFKVQQTKIRGQSGSKYSVRQFRAETAGDRNVTRPPAYRPYNFSL
jgi:rare lipoprotein A